MNTRKKSIHFIIGMLLLSSCGSLHPIQTYVPTQPIYKVEPNRVLLINLCDISAKKYRSKKEKLFNNLLDVSLIRMAEDINKRTGLEAMPVRNLDVKGLGAGERDRFIKELMNEFQATDAAVITSFDVYFNQTGVEVSRDSDGSKSRTAYYDIESRMDYAWYDDMGLFQENKVEISRYHSSRIVLSGLLAAGPNIVKKSDDATEITFENSRRYLNYYFPGQEARYRMLFLSKRIGNIKPMVKAGDYLRALNESILYTSGQNSEDVARANYNCAVLSEALGNSVEAKKYLYRSLELKRLTQAIEMLHDYP